MISLTYGNGRYVNNVIRNYAAYQVGLTQEIPVRFGIDVSALGFSFTSTYPQTTESLPKKDISEEDVINYINEKKNIETSLNFMELYCQEKPVMNHFRLWLISPSIKNSIMTKNTYSYDNNNLFVHVRLGDISISNNDRTVSINYYVDCIEKIQFTKGFISSDSPNHPMIRFLINKYNLELVRKSEPDTILFGSSCKHIVLSNGSFSWLIGTMGFNSQVWFPQCKPEKQWHPNYYCDPSWHEVSW